MTPEVLLRWYRELVVRRSLATICSGVMFFSASLSPRFASIILNPKGPSTSPQKLQPRIATTIMLTVVGGLLNGSPHSVMNGPYLPSYLHSFFSPFSFRLDEIAYFEGTLLQGLLLIPLAERVAVVDLEAAAIG